VVAESSVASRDYIGEYHYYIRLQIHGFYTPKISLEVKCGVVCVNVTVP